MGWRIWLVAASLFSVPVLAQTEEQNTNEQDDALNWLSNVLNEAIGGDGQQTLEQLRRNAQLDESKKLTALEKRKAREEVSKKNRNVITPHKRNCFTFLMSDPNVRPFDGLSWLMTPMASHLIT